MVDVLIDTCLRNFTTIYLQITSQHMLSSSGFCGKAMQWHSLALDISSNKPSLVFAMKCYVLERAKVHRMHGYGGLPVMFTQVAVFVQHTSNVML